MKICISAGTADPLVPAEHSGGFFVVVLVFPFSMSHPPARPPLLALLRRQESSRGPNGFNALDAKVPMRRLRFPNGSFNRRHVRLLIVRKRLHVHFRKFQLALAADLGLFVISGESFHLRDLLL